MTTEITLNVLRERFTIEDIDGKNPPMIALSNRFVLPLYGADGKIAEMFVIRGQMLHTVVRMAGLILHSFERMGPLMNRADPTPWASMWEKAAGSYEYDHNPNLWVAVYYNGKPVFENGSRHSFLDILEQCEAKGVARYEESLRTAEELFAKAGRAVVIHYSTNIACNVHAGGAVGRSALMLRGAHKTTTFILMGEKRDKTLNIANPAHFIAASANFLEGIQLSFLIGQGHEKLRHNLIAQSDTEGMALVAARVRMDEIAAHIANFESMYEVHYRPEKPNFGALVATAEAAMRRRIEEEEER